MDLDFINKFFGTKYGANSAVKMSVDILNAIYDMEYKDYESINYPECYEKYTLIAHQNYNTGSISSEDSHKQEELTKIFQELRIRFYARITAYVTTISQLEGHLQHHFGVLYGAKESSYRKKINIPLLNWNIEFNVSAKSLKYAAKIKTQDTKKEFKARKQEIKSYLDWRHLVFAHLADTTNKQSKPMIEQYVRYELGRSPIQLNHTCLALGYEQGQNMTLNQQTGKYEDMSKYFPKITIIDGHQAVLQHYKNWQKTFEKYQDSL